MAELVVGLIVTAILTFILGLVTTWTFLVCLLVSAAVVFLGVIVIGGDDGPGNWLN